MLPRKMSLVSCSPDVARGEHMLVPAGGEDGADGRFAHLAAIAVTVFGQQPVEALIPTLTRWNSS